MTNQMELNVKARVDAGLLLEAIGVSKIVVIDDQYARSFEFPDFLEILSELFDADSARAKSLLPAVDFERDYGIWSAQAEKIWDDLPTNERENLFTRVGEARASRSLNPDPVTKSVGNDNTGPIPEENGDGAEQKPQPESNLQSLLRELPKCQLLTLSLAEWQDQKSSLLKDAVSTLFLFDRDFSKEKEGATEEGLVLLREAQQCGAAMCGLITHTASIESEQAEWLKLSKSEPLDKHGFLVIAKERLAAVDTREHYGFLRLVRLAALSKRCDDMKQAAWDIFEKSLGEARTHVDSISVSDFDQVILASSRKEGVWEPETLFRVFGAFMRREARRLLHADNSQLAPKLLEARRVSSVPHQTAADLRTELEPPCAAAIKVHHFEMFESHETLNKHHLPIDLGDIFEDKTGNKYILLGQPCDLMVRSDGKRAYDGGTCTRIVTLVEVREAVKQADVKPEMYKIPWFDQTHGAPAYAHFSCGHDVLLAVLDLCVLNPDGGSLLDLEADAPLELLEPWKNHLSRLKKFFKKPISAYNELAKKQIGDVLKKRVIPSASLSVNFEVKVDGQKIMYGIKRVGRLHQPRSGALLTAFSQHKARAAFEHDLDHRTGGAIEDLEVCCSAPKLDDSVENEAVD